MDQRRAAGALLALVVCITTTAAAPTASNQTGLDLYDSSIEGCYYNFQHYGEGDRIMTNEPCLNCTCHNRMLMCYLRVCPFTKPIGQDCTVEKRADQCCPIVTCPDVPVDLLTSTTTSPAEYGATGVGKLDKYGCSINGKYFPEGSKVPPTPNKPCEHCYCIRNMTTCVMQECTLHVDGCTPIYHKDVCCPVRYSCDHPEDETLLLDDMTTTVRPTPGFLLTTTTLSPVTQMSQDCIHDDQIFPDGALIKTEKACEHCYCMKGDIVCVVQECGTPMENEGKNCTSQPPREGQCCPDTYICEGDEVTTEPPADYTTQHILEELTTRRVGIEGSGYRNEPDEPAYTEVPSAEPELEGSGYEQPTEPAIEGITPSKEVPEMTTEEIDLSLHYGTTTLRTPTLEEIEKTTEPDKGLNTVPSDEDSYKPLYTTPSNEDLSDNKQDLDKDKSTVRVESSTPADIPKDDEIIPTTESLFKKEESDSTEAFDFTEEKTTIIPVSDDKESTTAQEDDLLSHTKAPFMEELEKQSTLSPEFTEKGEEQFEPKPHVTESSLEMTASEGPKYTSPEIITIGPPKTETTTAYIEKADEATNPDENEVEDVSTTLAPGRIPGEGDCLLNEITYRNNSEVPSYNACDTGCRCVSSIVKCDRMICSPPPEYMSNCQPTYDPPGSCCPTYVCHTGETMPPQSHSQMSGTEKPESAIECHGDECVLHKDKEPASEKPSIPELPSEKCDDGDCKAIPVDEPIIIPQKEVPLCDNEEDCKQIKPETSLCEGEKCKSTDVHPDCSGPECATDGAKPSVIPDQPHCENEEDCKQNKPETPACEGEGCGNGDNVECSGPECVTGSVAPIVPEANCDNEEGCKQIRPDIPVCQGEDCAHAECTGPECSTDTTIPVLPQQPICENDEECKQLKPEVPCKGDDCTNVDEDCTGPDCSDISYKPSVEPVHKPDQPCTDTSCRRKEPGDADETTQVECAGPECTPQMPTSDDDKISTNVPVVAEITTSKSETPTELPESYTSLPEENIKIQGDVTTSKPEIFTESQDVQPKPSIGDDEKLSSQTVSEDGYTNAPSSATEESPINEKDIPKEVITEMPDTESQTEHGADIYETDDKTQGPVEEVEPSEAPHVTDMFDIQTSAPQELPTKETEQEESGTKIPEQYEITTEEYTKPSSVTLDEGLLDVSTTPEDKLNQVTESSIPLRTDEESEVTKLMEESGITDSPELQKPTTKLPTPLDDHKDTLPKDEIAVDAVTEPVPQLSDVTDPDLDHKSEEPTIKDETTEQTEKEPGSVSDYTHSPTEVLDKTSEIQPTTEQVPEASSKAPDDISSITTSVPDQETEKQEGFTESPQILMTQSPEDSIPTQYDDHKYEGVTDKTDEDVGSTPAIVSEEEGSTAAVKPLTEDKNQKHDDTSENPEINEVEEEPVEKTDAPIPKFSESDETVTLSPTKDEIQKPSPSKSPEDMDESVTEEQDISTEEPSIPTKDHPEPEMIPSEPYIPVGTEISTEPSHVFDEATEAVTSSADVKVVTEQPAKSDGDQVTQDDSTEPSDLDDSKSVTESVLPHTASTQKEESHKDGESQLFEKSTTEHPADKITKKEETTVEPTSHQPEKSDNEVETSTLSTKFGNEDDRQDETEQSEKLPFVPATEEPAVTGHAAEIIPTLEPMATDSNIPESHVKEEEQQDTQKATTSSEYLITKALEDEIFPEVTEKTVDVTSGITQEMDVKKEEESSGTPSEEGTEAPQESHEDETPGEQGEESTKKQEDITTEGAAHIATEEPLVKQTSVPELPAHDEITDIPHFMTTVLSEKPTEESLEHITTTSPKLVEEGLDESTSSPQEVETESPAKYTVSVAQESQLPEDQGSPEDVATVMLQEVTTEKYEYEPEQESTTKSAVSPLISSSEEKTESPTEEEHTTLDFAELEEHTHKPVDDSSSLSPVEEDKNTTPLDEVTAEKETNEEDYLKFTTPSSVDEQKTTISESFEDIHTASLPSDESDEKEAPISTTNQPIKKIDEKEESDLEVPVEVPVQTEKTPTTEKPYDFEPQQETTIFDDSISVTSKTPESSEHTKVEEPEASAPELKPIQPGSPEEQESTQQPIDESEEPVKEPSQPTMPEPDQKPSEEFDEKPIDKPLDEPIESPENKPITEKPSDEPSEESSKPVEKPSEGPLEEPTGYPDKEPSEQTEKPIDQSSEQPADKPESSLPQDLGEPTEKSTDKPEPSLPEESVEPIEKATGKPEPSITEESAEPTEKSTDKPESSVQEEPVEPTEKSTEKPESSVQEEPVESTEKSTEKPEPSIPEESIEPAEKATDKPEPSIPEVSVEPTEKSTDKPVPSMPEESVKPAESETDKPEPNLPEESIEATEKSTDKPETSIPEESGEPAEKATDKPEPSIPEESGEPAEKVTDKPEPSIPEESAEPTEKATDKPEPSVPEESGEPAEKATDKPETSIPEESGELAEKATDKPEPSVPEESGEPTEKATDKPESTVPGEPVESSERSTDKPEPSIPDESVEPTEKVTDKPGPSIPEESAEPTENPEDKPLEESPEKPTEGPVKESTEEPTEMPLEEPAEKPTEPSEEPIEKPEEKPLDQPTDDSTEIPEETPSEKPSEEPAVQPSEKIPEEPTEAPVVLPVETSSEHTDDEISAKPTESPVEYPSEKPSETPIEVPVEKPEKEPSEEPTKSQEKPSDEILREKPAAEATEKLDEKPLEEQTDKPLEEPIEKPEEKPSEEPIGKPLDEGTEQPEDKPLEEPVERPEDKPIEVPVEKPTEQTESPELSQVPAETPEKPIEMSTSVPSEDKKTGEEGEEKPIPPPGEKPSDEPVEKATEKPEVATESAPQEKPVEPAPSTAAPEIPKPGFNDVQPTDEIPDDFPTSGGTSGYGTEPDYVEEDQAFGPGTCRYGGKVYVSAQQIPRDDPCDFCFCFRSDIICLQQSCPPPIHGCHEEPIQGFCCPRYECPVAMATTLNVTTTTTTTTTTLPPHFLPHAYKGAAQRRGCQIKGHTYKVGEVVRASSGPCLHCTCGGDGQMKCDPKACTPEPMLRQMIAAAVSAKRRR